MGGGNEEVEVGVDVEVEVGVDVNRLGAAVKCVLLLLGLGQHVPKCRYQVLKCRTCIPSCNPDELRAEIDSAPSKKRGYTTVVLPKSTCKQVYR